MKIALIGYGKMGKTVQQMAEQRGIHIAAIVSSGRQQWDAVAASDVCIDFTHPNSVLENVKRAAAMKKNIVIGTTGWHDHLRPN